MKIRIHEFFPVNAYPVGAEFLATLAEGIGRRFELEVEIAETLPIPGEALSREREQFSSERFLAALTEPARRDGDLHLGVTNVDLFTPKANFLFGEASPRDRVAVFSVARLRPSAYGQPDDPHLLAVRALKEAVHELGHAAGLHHCRDEGCVMWFSNSLEETDTKSPDFCADHRRELRSLQGGIAA